MRLEGIEQQAFQYFLGELSEEEQSQIEERFFEDEAYSLFLDNAENRLVELYATGKLNQAQTQNFENRFLISERRREMLHSVFAAQNEILLAEKNSKSFSSKSYIQ